ncbi:pyrophosphate-energized vacuolar membrane proton pump 1-like [Nicotiana tabacum]|uniref:Pyrophosphate-energized vacuolar membrane proton pump 1-like n=1 Tax=Nicotiana tabacum TaxID=4097 RepID=A0AC58T3H8_TOBAC
MTMKSVGSAALKMVEEVRRQFNTIPGLMEGHAKPDYATCVKISTDASIKEMIPPGMIVDFIFCLSVLLVLQSMQGPLAQRVRNPTKLRLLGDTIGDPLKDTSGPSLNILIKLMVVESLVFAPFFATHGGLLFKSF